jgi:hypothetical protein
MASYNEDYVIMSEVLRKIDMDENYHPTESELKVVLTLLELESQNSPKRPRNRNYANLEW